MIQTLLSTASTIDTTKLTEGERAVLSIVANAMKEIVSEMATINKQLATIPHVHPDLADEDFVKNLAQMQSKIDIMWTVGKWVLAASGMGVIAVLAAAFKYLFPALT